MASKFAFDALAMTTAYEVGQFGIETTIVLPAPSPKGRSTFPADPAAVAAEIARILSLPTGDKPFRSVVDFTDSGVDEVVAVTERSRRDFVTCLGFGELLEVKLESGESETRLPLRSGT